MEFHLNRNLSLQNPGNIRGSVNSVIGIGERWIIFKKCNRFSSGVWACVELLVLLTPRLHSYFLAASERCSASICGSVLIETTRVLLAFRSSRLLEEFLRWKLWNLHNHGKPSPRCCGRMFLFSRERRNINPKTHWNRNDGISAEKDEKTRFFFTHHHHEWRNPGGSPNVIFFSHLIWKKSILCFQFKSTDIYGTSRAQFCIKTLFLRKI